MTPPRSRLFPFIALAASVSAVVLAFGPGTAAAATSVNCSANHYALPNPIPSGTYDITGDCYGPFNVDPGNNVMLRGVSLNAALDGQGLGTTIGIDGATVQIEKMSIINGSTDGNGGGISAYKSLPEYNSAVVTLFGTRVFGNHAGFYGGGIALDDATLNLMTDSVVNNNNSDVGAGGIEVTNSSTLNVLRSTISFNVANGGPGGGLSVDRDNTSGKAYLNGAIIQGNTANDAGGGSYGGGIYLDGGAYLSAKQSTVNSNHANGFGWGGAISSSNSDLYLDHTNIRFNTATYGGGIMHWGGPTAQLGISLTNSYVDHNTSTYDGGGILNQAANGNADLWLDGTWITSNTSQYGGGGGIANYGSNGYMATLTASNSTFGGNQAANGEGGAIYQSNGIGNSMAHTTLSNTQVGLSSSPGGNKAVYGGGIFNENGDGISDLKLKSGTLVRYNTASVTGGGLFNCRPATYSIDPYAFVTLNMPNNVVSSFTCP